jgi:hypothetical protein
MVSTSSKLHFASLGVPLGPAVAAPLRECRLQRPDKLRVGLQIANLDTPQPLHIAGHVMRDALLHLLVAQQPVDLGKRDHRPVHLVDGRRPAPPRGARLHGAVEVGVAGLVDLGQPVKTFRILDLSVPVVGVIARLDIVVGDDGRAHRDDQRIRPRQIARHTRHIEEVQHHVDHLDHPLVVGLGPGRQIAHDEPVEHRAGPDRRVTVAAVVAEGLALAPLRLGGARRDVRLEVALARHAVRRRVELVPTVVEHRAAECRVGRVGERGRLGVVGLAAHGLPAVAALFQIDAAARHAGARQGVFRDLEDGEMQRELQRAVDGVGLGVRGDVARVR